MLIEKHPRFIGIDHAEPDEWDLDVRFGELETVACGCAAHDLAEFLPTGGGGTCNTDNPTCPDTCAGPTCAGTCPATCRGCPTDNCPTESVTCNNTHCFTCRSGCQRP